ncbi:phosphopyruvate hydratase [Microbacterium sp. ET2]|uniref:phosphopyruvate hydratase n=1 Tax=Microbacterium albipurpureum TaxID=3050384 RepID=UPI00259C7DC3|nr:phosphopyruvate hydratase [Microbacterium sp. ET2 (Ac-2212)]WJL96996.1 phosphopyruvate hydratase [Microbacterium sp. ET2 (Ac-2212)]
MPTTTISTLEAWEALDSRGRPTVGCRVTLQGGGTGRVITPSGASTGDFEAIELRDCDDRYDGYGTRSAVDRLRGPISDALIGLDAGDQRSVDAAIEALDADPALSGIGGNSALGASLATLTAFADADRSPLWRVLDPSGVPLIPLPMVNIISGGAHAGRAIDIQDILVVPLGSSSFTEGIEWAARVRAATAALLTEQGGWAALVADEGGLSARLESNEAALALVTSGIERSGLRVGDDVAIAVDIAASQLVDGAGQIALRSEDIALTTEEWIARLADWVQHYPIVSVEDPLGDNDWDAWRGASARLASIQLLGDDLFATNVDRIEKGIAEAIANSVLIKPNQAGLVTRTADAVTTSRRGSYATVVSARSGDTEDSWLADLAVGWRAGQIKVGSTMRSERTSKWNRLLEIEATHDTQYAGRAALALS